MKAPFECKCFKGKTFSFLRSLKQTRLYRHKQHAGRRAGLQDVLLEDLQAVQLVQGRVFLLLLKLSHGLAPGRIHL